MIICLELSNYLWINSDYLYFSFDNTPIFSVRSDFAQFKLFSFRMGLEYYQAETPQAINAQLYSESHVIRGEEGGVGCRCQVQEPVLSNLQGTKVKWWVDDTDDFCK